MEGLERVSPAYQSLTRQWSAGHKPAPLGAVYGGGVTNVSLSLVARSRHPHASGERLHLSRRFFCITFVRQGGEDRIGHWRSFIKRAASSRTSASGSFNARSTSGEALVESSRA